MSGSIGFVYVLRNDYMPDVYKIGCTERSPHARAAELSRFTGVPYPFEVVCFIEVEDFQRVESNLHKWCKEHRISAGREFFKGGLAQIVSLMAFYPTILSFCVVEPSFLSGEGISIDDLRSPWKRQRTKELQLRVIEGGSSRA